MPKSLPPAHRGRAYRFSYDLVLSLTVLLPGQGKRQKSKDIHIPIRVWANISLGKPVHTYDVLKPIIQTKDEAIIESGFTAASRRRSSGETRGKGDTVDSFRQYADHLVETVTANQDGTIPSAKSAPLSPSRDDGPLLSPHKHQVIRSRKSTDSLRPPLLDLPNGHSKSRARQGSFIKGDDELLVDGEEGGCGQAVEVLSRHSTKSELSHLLHRTKLTGSILRYSKRRRDRLRPYPRENDVPTRRDCLRGRHVQSTILYPAGIESICFPGISRTYPRSFITFISFLIRSSQTSKPFETTCRIQSFIHSKHFATIILTRHPIRLNTRLSHYSRQRRVQRWFRVEITNIIPSSYPSSQIYSSPSSSTPR